MSIFSWKNLSTALLLGFFLVFASACSDPEVVIEIALKSSASEFIADGQSSVTLTATVTEDAEAAAGQSITFRITSGTGTLSATNGITAADGTASVILKATQNGSISIEASVTGAEAPAVVTVTAIQRPDEVSRTISVPADAQALELTAVVINPATGQGEEGIAVEFEASAGSLVPASIRTVNTNAQGRAILRLSDATSDVDVTARIDPTLGLRLDSLAITDSVPKTFTLQLLHVGDPEIGGVQDLKDVNNFAKLLNAFKTTYTDSTVVISSGDNFLPGPATTASADRSVETLLGRAGQAYADIVMLNEMGFEASALGNHDLDFGTSAFSEIITARDAYPGTTFPYLSSNSDFSTDSNTADNVTADGLACNQGGNKLAKSCVITLPNGVKVGVVGATTPTNDVITSIGGITVLPANDSIAELVSDYIQPAVDALTAQGINVIILASHMQQLPIEAEQIAPLVKDVDIIIGGGSNTVLLDANDRVNPLGGTPSTQYSYPIERKDANGDDVLVVNTDGNYNYLGRLVVEFTDGKVNPASYDETVSGAFSTNDADLSAINSLGLTPSENARVKAITDALIAIIEVKDGNIVGLSSVFLNGERGDVRTEETNFGDLTADANLWYARQFDANTAISLKNGGGIRTSIGTIFVPTGSVDPNDYQRLPRDGNIVSQLDLENTLRFNNDLVVITVTAEKIKELFEHGVAESAPGKAPGRFPQVAGVRFSFDETLAAGSRIQNLVLVNDRGVAYDVIVQGGQLQGDPNRSFRLVTLGFLANGGDGYPFGTLVDPLPLEQENTASTGVAFADIGTEQRALAEYLDAFYRTVPFGIADVAVERDIRIQQLARNGGVDNVLSVTETQAPISLSEISSLGNLGAIEVSAFDANNQRIYTVSSENPVAIQVIEASDLSKLSRNSALSDTISNAMVNFVAPNNGYLPNSIAYNDGLIAVAAERNGLPDTDPAYDPLVDDKIAPGKLFLFNATTGALVASPDTDALPDMVTFTPDGQMLLVANEGEPLDENQIGDLNGLGYDPIGSVQVFDRNGTLVTTLSFSQANVAAAIGLPNGLRIHPLNDPNNLAFPNADPGLDIEPEYISINAEGTRAYVSLQENNGIAVIDLTAQPPTFSSIFGLGVVDYGSQDIDASDKDGGFALNSYPGLFGMYMPDGLRHFRPYMLDSSGQCVETAGEGFLALPGEGDTRDVDEARAKDLDYDASFASLAAVGDDALLGRLNVSPLEDADGFQDVLYTFGSRSLALYALEAGTVVGDTKEDSDRITNIAGTRNDGRSDNKGAEPEDAEVFHLPGKPCQRTFAAVGLERAEGVMVYEITNPQLPRFVQFIQTGEEPEGIKFVSADHSPNGKPFLIVTNTDSGNISILEIDASGL